MEWYEQIHGVCWGFIRNHKIEVFSRQRLLLTIVDTALFYLDFRNGEAIGYPLELLPMGPEDFIKDTI